MATDQIFTEDNQTAYNSIPDESIQTIVSSPIYFATRDYPPDVRHIFDENKECHHEWVKDIPSVKEGTFLAENEESPFDKKYQIYHFCRHCGAWRGKVGHEPNYMDRFFTIDEKDIVVRGFISHLADIYCLYYSKLKREGSLFVIIGDTFSSRVKGSGGKKSKKAKKGEVENTQAFKPILMQLDEPDGSQLMIPFYFADEMKRRGWFLKQIPIWRKPNPMTSSNLRKWTMDYESILWFVKDIKAYYFNTQFEPKKMKSVRTTNAKRKHEGYGNQTMTGFKYDSKQKTHKIARASPLIPEDIEILDLLNDWVEIPPKGTHYAHFATFPPRLIFPLISATSKKGDVVCDIWAGIGTTGLVALAMERDYIGIEINGKYNEIYKERKEKEMNRFKNQYRLFIKEYFPVKCANIMDFLKAS